MNGVYLIFVAESWEKYWTLENAAIEVLVP
jgi:hypothetical protein